MLGITCGKQNCHHHQGFCFILGVSDFSSKIIVKSGKCFIFFFQWHTVSGALLNWILKFFLKKGNAVFGQTHENIKDFTHSKFRKHRLYLDLALVYIILLSFLHVSQSKFLSLVKLTWSCYAIWVAWSVYCNEHSVLLAFSFYIICSPRLFFFLSLYTLRLGWTFPIFLTLISSNFKGVSQ